MFQKNADNMSVDFVDLLQNIVLVKRQGSRSEISGFFLAIASAPGWCPRLVPHTSSVSVRVPSKGGSPEGPTSCVTGGDPAWPCVALRTFAARTEQRMLQLANEATGRSEQEC
jgi:hypothetical protein